MVPIPSFDGSREHGFGLFLIDQGTHDVRYFVDEIGERRIRMILHR